ncbi:hypothetical protein GCM10027456_40420 [Kineosporia babensis]
MTPAVLRKVLMSPNTSGDLQDEVWRRLIRWAREVGSDGKPVCVAVAAPALSRQVSHLAAGCSASAVVGLDDLEAEVVVGFLERIGTLDIDDLAVRRVCGRLVDAGVRRARRAVRLADAEARDDLDACVSLAAASGHPETVLWRAVRAGVMAPEESELIARTRLEGRTLSAEAVRQEVGLRTAWTRRRQAETQLLEALRIDSI